VQSCGQPRHAGGVRPRLLRLAGGTPGSESRRRIPLVLPLLLCRCSSLQTVTAGRCSSRSPALPLRHWPGGVRNLKMGRVYRGTISQIARYQSWRTGSYSAAAHGAVHDAHSFSYCSSSTMCCVRTQSWSHGRATVPRLQATGTTTATGTDSRPVLEAWSPSGASPRACPPVSRCRPCSSSSCRAHRPCACAVRMRPQPLCICACACAPTCAVHAHLTCAFAPQPLTHARALIAAISRRLQPLHLNAARRARDTRCLGERVSMPPECGSAGRRLP
jgi:hypothetical protein